MHTIGSGWGINRCVFFGWRYGRNLGGIMKIFYSKGEKNRKIYMPICLLTLVVRLMKFHGAATMNKEDLSKIVKGLKLVKLVWRHLEIITAQDKTGKKISIIL